MSSTYNFVFWLHLALLLLTWAGPFCFSWYLICTAYLLVMAQFWIFKECLMNKKHNFKEDDNATFYAFLLEKLGFSVNRKKVKFYVREVIYFILIAFTLFWQLILGNKALLF